MRRKVLTIVAPVVAVLTLMIGLRVGAGEAVRAATLFGSPLGHAAPDGSTRIAWQMLTFLDDRGVKETIALQGLTVTARSRGHEARWSGASNKDGIAEVSLSLEGLAFGDPLDIEVRADGEPQPLATGPVTWTRSEGERSTEDGGGSGLGPGAGSLGGERRIEPGGAVRPTLRTGSIGLDVVVEGDRLIAGFPTSLWVRATPPYGVAATGLVVDLEPEPGLNAERAAGTTCGAGWVELPVTAFAHVVGVGLVVHRPGEAEQGRWFGALPVAPGAFFLSTPRVLHAGEAATVVVIAPNPRDVVYVELDDTRGRVAAAALPLAVEPGAASSDPTPRARFELPPLAPGLHWIVASGEPHGAERLAGAAVARTILVGDAVDGDPTIHVQNACSIGPYLAQRSAPGFARWVALEGLPARSAKNRTRHTLGILIGVLSLLAAGILETLLLVAASREARISLELAALDDDDAAAKVTATTPGGGVVVAILIAVLGLALLAVLLITKG